MKHVLENDVVFVQGTVKVQLQKPQNKNSFYRSLENVMRKKTEVLLRLMSIDYMKNFSIHSEIFIFGFNFTFVIILRI